MGLGVDSKAHSLGKAQLQPETWNPSGQRLDSVPPNNPQIQTTSSRAVFEGSTQVNPIKFSFIFIYLYK
jgi:hypothetical protein